MKLSAGKLAGLRALSNREGIIAAAAMDQRTALQREFGSPVNDETLRAFKSIVTETLSPLITAILLDPEYGLPAASKRANNCGLLLAYEKSGFDSTIPGRLPALLDGWSVEQLKHSGANAVKVLLYYDPHDQSDRNTLKHHWVKRVGDECIANDISFFLEIICYAEDMDGKSFAYAKQKPLNVRLAIEEFSKDIYGVDVLKMEVPVNMKFVQGVNASSGEIAYTRSEAKTFFLECSSAARKPFIFLSAGVTNDEFRETLELAAEAGSRFSGVLCGRAIWKGGIPVFSEHGVLACREWMQTNGIANLRNVFSALDRATPWQTFYDDESMENRADL